MNVGLTKSLRRPHGFTLIELLVVIAIVGILAAMILPALAGAKRRAYRVQCISNLKQWGVAFNLYAADHNDFMPPGWDSPNGMWMIALRQYYKADKIRYCPEAKITRDSLPNYWDITLNATALSWGIMGSNGYPVLNWGFAGLGGSYGINGWMHNPPNAVGEILDGTQPGYWRKLSKASTAMNDNVPVFADCMWDGSEPRHTDAAPAKPGIQDTTSNMSIFAIPRHAGKRPVDIAFADGHVRMVGLKELWELNWSTTFDVTYATKRGQWPIWMNGYR